MRVGIDLGTTYCAIAYVDPKNGQAKVIRNSEGSPVTPSVLYFDPNGAVLHGEEAKSYLEEGSERTVNYFKYHMGDDTYSIFQNGREYTATDLSAELLKGIVREAEDAVGENIYEAVITVPAYFDHFRRQATMEAGQKAGLQVLSIISEPTAAVFAYGIHGKGTNQTVLVYDLGGGTFDVTVMAITDGRIDVICSDGSAELGGRNWDDAVMRYLAGEFCSETGFDGAFDEYAQQDLRLKAEKAKKQLSSRPEVPVMIDAAGLRSRVTLTRDIFNQITETLLNESMERTDAAIAVAKDKGYEIDEILLVGGSTWMPQVKEKLVGKYGREPKILEPDEAVAKGASIYALGAYEAKAEEIKDKVQRGEVDTRDQEQKEEVENFSETAAVSTAMIPALGGKRVSEILSVITSKSYGLKVLVNGEERCNNMIVKNEKMPDGKVSVSRQFGTAQADQETAELEIYESDFMDEYYGVDEDFKLGDATLELPGNLPAGAPIEVSFTLDKEGILTVAGKDLTGGREITAQLQASSGTTMSKEEVAAAKRKSRSITVQ